jgi:acetyl esterase/lipase
MCAGQAEAEDVSEGVSPVVYKTVGDVSLRLHVFEPKASSADASARRACIVFFFGGGWRSGTPKQFYPHCKYFATRGVVAMAAEYRVRNTHGTTPAECVKDGRSAVRWIRVHADDLGVDPKRIIAGGGSAGGHVAVCTAMECAVDEEGDPNVSADPNALVLFNPVLDTTRERFRDTAVGGDVRVMSPVHHVASGMPPTIIFHGTADTTVPVEDAQRFTELMRETGNTCELVLFEGESHGFFNYSRSKEIFNKTVREAEHFLVSQGVLHAESTGRPS